jgi:hypothetical protein
VGFPVWIVLSRKGSEGNIRLTHPSQMREGWGTRLLVPGWLKALVRPRHRFRPTYAGANLGAPGHGGDGTKNAFASRELAARPPAELLVRAVSSASSVAVLEEQADGEEAEGEKGGQRGLYAVAMKGGQNTVEPPAGGQDKPNH